MLRYCANCKKLTKHERGKMGAPTQRCIPCKSKFCKCATCHNLLEPEIARSAEAMNIPFFCDYHLGIELQKEIECIMREQEVDTITAVARIIGGYLDKFSKANELCKRKWQSVVDYRKRKNRIIRDTSKCQREIKPEEIAKILGAEIVGERKKK